MKALMALYLPGFASSIKVFTERLEFTHIKWLTMELSRCVKHFFNWKGQQWMSEDYIQQMLDLLAKVVETVQQDKEERLVQLQEVKHKITEEDQEEIIENIEWVDKILEYSMEISGVCLRTLPE